MLILAKDWPDVTPCSASTSAGATIRDNTKELHFHCWDMDGGMGSCPSGTDDNVCFIPDGNINVADFQASKKMSRVRGSERDELVLHILSNDTLPHCCYSKGVGAQTCDVSGRRRELSSSGSALEGSSPQISARWGGFTCNAVAMSQDKCEYTCNARDGCLHSLAPQQLDRAVAGGTWYHVPLPAGWTLLQIEFATGMFKCTPDIVAAANEMCANMTLADCDEMNFETDPGSTMMLAAPLSVPSDGGVMTECASNAQLEYFVPTGHTQEIDFRSENAYLQDTILFRPSA